MSTLLNIISQLTERSERKREPAYIREVVSGRQIPNLQSQVSVLTNSISDEAVRLAVGKVLTDLVLLLDYLSLVAGSRNFGGIREVVSILNTVRMEAYSLAVFIEENALRLEGLGDGLSETLDSTAYAINHEVSRIFNGDLAHITLDRDDHETRGTLQHAQGVLTNCFQQCMVNLARVFDASLTDAGLFQDWQSRRESSLILYQDLSDLIALIQANLNDSPKYAPGQSLDNLEDRLASFREGSMHFLMYRDWHQFEILSEAIVASIRRAERPADLLHRMACYLETLLAHVKARSALAHLTLEASVIHEIEAASF